MSLIPSKTDIGNLTMKIDLFTGGRRLNIMPEARSESNKKKIGTHFYPFLKKIHKIHIKNVYVEFNCASIRKTIIFHFCKPIAQYLIKGRFFLLLEIRL
jgi:hypothetical protein